MTPLRKRMLEDMRLRNFSAETQRSYTHYIAEFAMYFKTSPDRLGPESIRDFQLYPIEERRLTPDSVNCFTSAAKFLFLTTLEMPWSESYFARLRVPNRLPVALSFEEVERFFRHAGLLKQHDIFSKIFSGRSIAHGMAAIFDHEGLAGVALEIGQALGEGARGDDQLATRRGGALRGGAGGGGGLGHDEDLASQKRAPRRGVPSGRSAGPAPSGRSADPAPNRCLPAQGRDENPIPPPPAFLRRSPRAGDRREIRPRNRR